MGSDGARDGSSSAMLRTLGMRIEALRMTRGLTQTQAARRAGLSQGQWSDLEAGKRDPRLSTILRIQHALEVDFLDSFFGRGPSHHMFEEHPPDQG
jgi:transcriptional regulator with XRE-family HTH domain